MATHLPASTRTPGGAVHPRKDPTVRKSNARIQLLLAIAALCGVALLTITRLAKDPKTGISSQPERNTRAGNHVREIETTRKLADPFRMENGSERESRIRLMLSAWADHDAEAALIWVAKLEDPNARHSAFSTVCLTLADEDPRRALTLALSHGADEEDDRGLIETLTMRWCEKQPETVLNWARDQPPGEWRERLLSRASFVLSKSDPAAAAHLVSGLAPGTVQDEAAMAVLHQWALQDSTAALEWAEAFPESALRSRALAEVSNIRKLKGFIRSSD